MRFLARLLLVPFGLVLAMSTSALVLIGAALFDPSGRDVAGRLLAAAFQWLWSTLLDPGWRHPGMAAEFAALSQAAMTLVVAPSLLIALIGEVAGWRALAWYVGGTGFVTAAMPWLVRQVERPGSAHEAHLTLVLLIAGCAAGLAYWMVAGGFAGRRSPPMPAPAPGPVWRDTRPR